MEHVGLIGNSKLGTGPTEFYRQALAISSIQPPLVVIDNISGTQEFCHFHKHLLWLFSFLLEQFSLLLLPCYAPDPYLDRI